MRSGLLCLLLYVGLGGCTAHGVRCDGPLRPINAVSPAQSGPQHTENPTVVP
jgi:hypothetical protein